MDMVIKIPGEGIARVALSDYRGEIYTPEGEGWRGELFRAGITRLAVRKNKSNALYFVMLLYNA